MLWTIASVLKWTTDFFQRKNLDSPKLDAEILLAHVLGKNRVYLYSHFDEPLEKSELASYHESIDRRANGEPVAYITGQKEFFTIPFRVESGVLIPRPETEELVAIVTSRLKNRESIEILDLCTGSGCIALSILKFLPNSKATAIDLSDQAIKIANENSDCLNLQDRIEIIKGDLFEPIDPEKKFDAIVSNPPYIPQKDLENLPIDVRNFEPMLALDGGIDGLDFYRKIAGESKNFLAEDGFVAVEIGIDQSKDVEEIFRRDGFNQIEIRKDLGGIDRVVIARRDW
ncbi:MAG: peptide chain release factor N(5)-glutamine methyltransferase [Selenomonadaceae bacterium]|nr:peptide chain release factor N(5)-glutamine methyltransferase [Selenomonadaceae bacterium]